MKTTILLCLLSIGLAKGQDYTTPEKLDSVIAEANKIYHYERVAWQSSDLVRTIPSLRDSLAGYIVYEAGDTLVCGYLNLTQDKIMVQYDFVKGDLTEPVSVITKPRPITSFENKLVIAKNLMVEQAIEGAKIDFYIPEGNSINLVLFPIEKGYRMYFLSGIGKSDVIPFGNDVMLEANKSYQLIKVIQFHSGPLNTPTKMEGMEVSKLTHSHRKENPYIPATEICTFRLYAPFSKLKEFSIYIKTGQTLTYHLEDNQITVDNQ